MNENKIGVAVTVQVGGVAVTVELKKADPKEPPVKIKAVRNGGYLEYRKDEKR